MAVDEEVLGGKLFIQVPQISTCELSSRRLHTCVVPSGVTLGLIGYTKPVNDPDGRVFHSP